MTPESILRELIDDVCGIDNRQRQNVLTRYNALVDRVHEAKRQLERAEVLGESEAA